MLWLELRAISTNVEHYTQLSAWLEPWPPPPHTRGGGGRTPEVGWRVLLFFCQRGVILRDLYNNHFWDFWRRLREGSVATLLALNDTKQEQFRRRGDVSGRLCCCAAGSSVPKKNASSDWRSSLPCRGDVSPTGQLPDELSAIQGEEVRSSFLHPFCDDHRGLALLHGL